MNDNVQQSCCYCFSHDSECGVARKPRNDATLRFNEMELPLSSQTQSRNLLQSDTTVRDIIHAKCQDSRKQCHLS